MHLSQQFINEKLLEIGPSLLKEPYKRNWTPTNPTFGYCYIISEAIYHYYSKPHLKAFCINFGTPYGTHWFCKSDEEILDYTAEQFPFSFNHSTGIGKGFFKGSIQTKKGYISKRGYEMAKQLNLV